MPMSNSARVRRARREGVRVQEPVVEPPQAWNRLEPDGLGPGSSARRPLCARSATLPAVCDADGEVEATVKGLRCSRRPANGERGNPSTSPFPHPARVRAGHIAALSTVRDVDAFDRPVRLVWRKRCWRCAEPLCPAKTWTEQTEAIGARMLLTERARARACRRVGKDGHSGRGGRA